MIKKTLRRQLMWEICAVICCLVFIGGILANILLEGGNLIAVFFMGIGLMIAARWFRSIRNNYNFLKKYCEKFNNPALKMQEISDYCNQVTPVCNTWINSEFIMCPEKCIIIDATRLIWAYTYIAETKTSKGRITVNYYLNLVLSDGSISTIGYNSLFSAKRVLQKINEELPYIFVEYDEEVDKLFESNIEILINEVEEAKASGRNDDIMISFADENLYGQGYTNFEEYKESVKPSIIKQLMYIALGGFGAVWLLIVAVMVCGYTYFTCTDLIQCTEATTAEIIDMEYYTEKVTTTRNHRTSTRWVEMCRPIYEYKTNQGEVIKDNLYTSYEVKHHKVKIGDKKVLYYNPDNPKQNLDKTEIPGQINICMLLGVICGTVGLFSLSIASEEIKRNKIEFAELEMLDEQTISMYP